MYVVTLPTSAAMNPKTFAERALAAGAEILEIRTDLTPHLQSFESPLPILVSLRENGMDLIASLQPQYVDIEGTTDITLPKGVTVIRSFHNFESTPSTEELESIVQDLAGKGADIVKIATTINSYSDVSTLDQLHERIPKNQKRVILGMGVRAHITRILSPLKNALTYTFIDSGEESATGQISLHLYKLTEHCKKPKIFGVLGGLEVKSDSPLIHNTLFHAHSIDAIFTAFLTDNLDDAWEYIEQHGVAGLSVTSPFKRDVITKLHGLDELSEHLQSVNTVVLESDGYKGYNKDVEGIRDGYNVLENAEHVCILGSGGVVPSVIHACKEKGIKRIHVFARNRNARDKLRKTFEVETSDIIELAKADPDIVIYAINVDITMELPDAKNNAYAIDLRYGKETRFLRDAKKKGYTVCNGIPMFLKQALGQFKCFTGLMPLQKDENILCTLYPSIYGK